MNAARYTACLAGSIYLAGALLVGSGSGCSHAEPPTSAPASDAARGSAIHSGLESAAPIASQADGRDPAAPSPDTQQTAHRSSESATQSAGVADVYEQFQGGDTAYYPPAEFKLSKEAARLQAARKEAALRKAAEKAAGEKSL